MKLKYNEFVSTMIDELKSQLGDVKVEETEVNKLNIGIKKGYTFRFKGSNVSPTIYMDQLYGRYQDGASIYAIADTVADTLKEFRSNPFKVSISKDDLDDKLYCQIVNADINRVTLKGTPHIKVTEDLALIPRYRVDEEKSIIVNNEMCVKKFKLSPQELIEKAKINTSQDEFICKSMSEIIRDLFIKDGVPEEYVDELVHMQELSTPMYVLHNTSQIDGAVAMAYPDVLDMALDVVGEDFFILPSSRHEVILLGQSTTATLEELKDMVIEVNSEMVDPKDKLSDQVYIYDSKARKVSLALERVDVKEKEISKSKTQESMRAHT